MHKKRKWSAFLVPVLFIAIGAGIFLYPHISNWYMEEQQKKVIHQYQTSIAREKQEDIQKLWKAAITYNENLSGDPVHDPFVKCSGYVLPKDYEEVLNVNHDGVMGHLTIGKINVSLPIYHGCGEEALKKGAGHLEGTSLPIGRNSQHAILCAHRGLPSALLFTKLNELEKGDSFRITVLDKTFFYEVDEIRVVKPKEVEKLRIIKGKDYVTLMTCTPYGINTHRLLVRGKRVQAIHEVDVTSQEKEKTENLWIIGGGIIILLSLVCVLKLRKKAKHEQGT